MSNLVGNPKDRFYHDTAHMVVEQRRCVFQDNFVHHSVKTEAVDAYKNPCNADFNKHYQHKTYAVGAD